MSTSWTIMLRLTLGLHLFIISSLVVVKCEQLNSLSFESPINPDMVIKNCTIGESCKGSINSTTIYYYAVQYSYEPDTAIRITTNMTFNDSQNAPILVVVRQIHGIVSWTLPYEFPNGMIYSSVARILCAHNEVNRSHPHTSTIFIEISTSNVELIDYEIHLDDIIKYVLRPTADEQLKQEFVISPSMPIYYKVIFPPNNDNIFIRVTSDDNFCAVVSVQSFDCPVYDVGEIGIRQGHYQTMSRSASFNVYFSEFTKRNEFLLVFLVKPTDADCLNYKESTNINPAGIIDVQRTKNAKVIITSPTSFNYLYATIFVTIGVFLSIYIATFIIMWKNDDIYEYFGPDSLPLLSRPAEQELIEQPFAEPFTQSQRINGEEDVVEISRPELESQASTVEVIETSIPGFVSVSDLCVKEYRDLKQQFRIYPTTMLTIAIFYSLPVIQLVLQYQINIDSIGNEDICYFNFLCTRELFKLTAFNNIFSNIGYCALGILFTIIVYRRDKAYTRFLSKHSDMGKKYGIPQHFGLFYALGIGLLMEGIMSACYHVCPSRQNFQFDTSFMFIMAVLNIIKIYQTRHADIDPHSTRTFSFLAIIIFVTVVGVYYDQLWFWISYAIIHVAICLTFTAKIYYMGRLKISFRIHAHLYRLVTENGFFSRPRYLNRMLLLVTANLVNIGFAIYGVTFQPESFPNHLLFIFLGNLALYFLYYIGMKAVHREKFARASKVFLTLALCSWISSLFFFYDEVKSYDVQPAISRTYNKECIILDTFDAHDVWHILSSFGLFFSFLSMLTIDDGVRNRLRKDLAAF